MIPPDLCRLWQRQWAEAQLAGRRRPAGMCLVFVAGRKRGSFELKVRPSRSPALLQQELRPP
jgi:hypothetical protein